MEETKPEEKAESKISPIRTYEGDVEAILKEGEGSFAKIAIAENDRRILKGFNPEETEPTENTKLVWGISIGLILFGIGTLSAIYFFRSQPKPPAASNEPRPILAADAVKNLDIAALNRDQIIKLLVNERDSAAALSSITAVKLTEGKGETAKAASAAEFFKKLDSAAPSELLRSLDDNFMFGIHVLSKNQPFLILKTNYYDNAFAGMLAWEKTLREELGPIFIYTEAETARSTSAQVLNQNPAFEDMVIKNRDARALRGQDGKIIFLYSFPDKNTIIITTNPDTLEQVAVRLLAGKLVQ